METSNKNEQIFSRCNIFKWWEAGYTGKGVRVAIMDDGSLPHPLYQNATYPLGTAKNVHDHATCVQAVINEVAPDCEIVMFHGFNVPKNVDWILENGVDVINVSQNGVLGSFGKFEATQIPIFCCSGNEGNENKLYTPADQSWTNAVGAWNANLDQKTNYSNAGEALDFVAYTVEAKNTSGGYTSWTGTSFTTPFMVGMCALFLQRCKELGVTPTRAQVKQYFIDNALDSAEYGKDKASGYGIATLSKQIRPNRVDVCVNTDRALVNGAEKALDIIVPTIQGRTVVPLRFMGESLGCAVEWSQKENKASMIQY